MIANEREDGRPGCALGQEDFVRAWEQWAQAWEVDLERAPGVSQKKAQEAALEALSADDVEALRAALGLLDSWLGPNPRRGLLEQALGKGSRACALALALDPQTDTGPRGASRRGLLSLAIASGDESAFHALLPRCDAFERDGDQWSSWPLWTLASELGLALDPAARERVARALIPVSPKGWVTSDLKRTASEAVKSQDALMVRMLIEHELPGMSEASEESVLLWLACLEKRLDVARMVKEICPRARPWVIGYDDDNFGRMDALASACAQGDHELVDWILSAWNPADWPEPKSEQKGPLAALAWFEKQKESNEASSSADLAKAASAANSANECVQALRAAGWFEAHPMQSLMEAARRSGAAADQEWTHLLKELAPWLAQESRAFEVLNHAVQSGIEGRAAAALKAVDPARWDECIAQALAAACSSKCAQGVVELLSLASTDQARRAVKSLGMSVFNTSTACAVALMPWFEGAALDPKGEEMMLLHAAHKWGTGVLQAAGPVDWSFKNAFGFNLLECLATNGCVNAKGMEALLDAGALPGHGGWLKSGILSLMLENAAFNPRFGEFPPVLIHRLAAFGGQFEPDRRGKTPEDFWIKRLGKDALQALKEARRQDQEKTASNGASQAPSGQGGS